MDIVFVVVLSNNSAVALAVILNFTPLTATMIVLMSLLDDISIMTIAYDNTPVRKKPIR